MAFSVTEEYDKIWKKADELAMKEVSEAASTRAPNVSKLTKDERRQRHILSMMSLMIPTGES